MKYIPGLNGLRAIAVFLVIFFHWDFPPSTITLFLKKWLPDGVFGVNLFFVLSGFLISAILLIEKEKATAIRLQNKKIILNFYIRRFLRIFPIYYLTLFILYFTSLPDFHKNFIYYLTYTENFNVYFKGSWDSFCHTWSLAVEEQFYLIWPFIIIFTKKNKLKYVLFFFILLGPAFSIFQTLFLKPRLNAFVLPPSCFDAFAIGALIAYYYTLNELKTIKKWIKILLPFSVLLFIYWKLAPTGGHFQYFKRPSESIIASGLILFCTSNSYSILRNKLLENRVMYQLGLVSYGIYLFHYSIPYFYSKTKTSLNISFGKYDIGIDLLIMLFLVLTLAFFSYYFIEKPILNLKKRFNY
jgi:peptidoglycan/LPS O-acetylase OafA/YrhL